MPPVAALSQTEPRVTCPFPVRTVDALQCARHNLTLNAVSDGSAVRTFPQAALSKAGVHMHAL